MSSEKDNQPEQEDQQKLIEEFVMVTDADQSIAKEYLKKYSGNVVQAINEYFECMRKEFYANEAEDEAENDDEDEEAKDEDKTKNETKDKDDDIIFLSDDDVILLNDDDEAKVKDHKVIVISDDDDDNQDQDQEKSTESVKEDNDEDEDTKNEPKTKKIKSSKDIKDNGEDGDEEDNVESSDSSTKDQTGDNNSKPLRLIRHITYNIDSLNEKNLQRRVEAVCRIILEEKATIIFLQEVKTVSETIIKEKLQEQFHLFNSYQTENIGFIDYYTMILIRKESWIKILNIDDEDEQVKIIDFPQTQMGRNILQVNILIDNHLQMCLFNTHLESTKEFGSIRKLQLRFLFKYLSKIDQEKTIICGGDMNLRDKELQEIGGLPPGFVDAWIATGSRKEVQYTWDMMRNDNLQWYQPGTNFKPRMRFDRIWFRPSKKRKSSSSQTKIDLIHFGLIGLQRLKPHVCFPSDHWGVITSYQIY